MLVLTRRPDESIIINGNIRVKILSVEGGHVRIGIVAPRDVRIRRQELEPRCDCPQACELHPKRGPDIGRCTYRKENGGGRCRLPEDHDGHHQL